MRHPDIEECCLPNVHLDLPSIDLGKCLSRLATSRQTAGQVPGHTHPDSMEGDNQPMQPYHAHVYFDDDTRSQAEALHRGLSEKLARGDWPSLLFVGSLKQGPAGPHPTSQFEVHFLAAALPAMRLAIGAAGRTALIHPLTDDDLADHTNLAEWMGTPLELDLSTLDPPGHNRGVGRFGKSDF